MESAKKDFRLPLPERLYERLRSEAQRSKTPATRLVRQALERYLGERERQAVHDAVVEYATRAAGTPEDLDQQLEAAGLECLAGLEPLGTLPGSTLQAVERELRMALGMG